MHPCVRCDCASRLASRLCVPGLGVRVCAGGVVCGCGSRWTSRLCVFSRAVNLDCTAGKTKRGLKIKLIHSVLVKLDLKRSKRIDV